MATPNPALIDLSGGHSGTSNPWYQFLSRSAERTWTLPHAVRRLSGIDSRAIVVLTAPELPIWLARLVRLKCIGNQWDAPRILLADGRFPARYRNPLASLDQARYLFLSIGIHRAISRVTSLYWIQELLGLAATSNRALHFVPLIFHWNLSPRRRNYPPIYGFAFHNRHKMISTGSPLIIEPGITISPPSPQSIRRHQLKNWNRESRAILGNRKLPMRKMVEAIQKEPLLNRQLEVISTQEKDTLPTLLTRVSAYVREIAADYSYRAPLLWDKVISGFLRRNFTSIDFDLDGIDQLRLLLRDRKRVILTPSHRSHMDYLLISYSIFKQGLACPLVAAGKNLSFWPMGYFFRKTGAFFIRRTFKGLDIYPHVFRAYLWHILSRFQPVEFFIEGGRSRNGALLPAKLGMLNMILEAIRSGRLDDVQIVPLAVNYDRIPEEQSYINELQGKAKRKERMTSLLKSAHLLTRKFGQVAVATGQPLSLKSLIRPELSSLEQKEYIGCSIMNQIRLTMPVTPGSILMTAAMGSPPGKKLSEDELLDLANALLKLMKTLHPQSPLAMDFHRQSRTAAVWQSGIQRMMNIGNLIQDQAGRLGINPDRRLQADYLRNSILSLLLGPGLTLWVSNQQETTFSAEELAVILCPECHPIPVAVMLDELRNGQVVVQDLSESVKRCLLQNFEPVSRLCHEIQKSLKADTVSIESVVARDWKKRCRAINSDMGGYPEISTAILQTGLLRGFKRLASRQVND